MYKKIKDKIRGASWITLGASWSIWGASCSIWGAS